MSNSGKIPEQTILLAEVIVKVAAIERLLIKSNILSENDLSSEMKKIGEEITKIIVNKQN
jgi:hypothetical protein